MKSTVNIGICACLVGKDVRYDGKSKAEPFLCYALSQFVHYTIVCPETESGMPVPRPPMVLMGNPLKPRMVEKPSGTDNTDRILQWTHQWLERMKKTSFNGFIFKTKSPSCGMDQVPVFDADANVIAKGAGVFSGLFQKHFPHVPISDEIKLTDTKLRHQFLSRIFTHVPAELLSAR